MKLPVHDNTVQTVAVLIGSSRPTDGEPTADTIIFITATRRPLKITKNKRGQEIPRVLSIDFPTTPMGLNTEKKTDKRLGALGQVWAGRSDQVVCHLLERYARNVDPGVPNQKPISATRQKKCKKRIPIERCQPALYNVPEMRG